MSYAAVETSRYSALPYELYWFTDGVNNWYLTSGDISRTYNGQIYTPESISRGEIDQNQEIQSGAIKVAIPNSHDIASRYVSFIPAAQMNLVIYRGHDGDSEVVTIFIGKVSSGAFSDAFEMNCVPLQDVLKKRVPAQVYQSQCNWVLFGAGCGLSRGAFMASGTITSVSADAMTIQSAAFATKPDGYWVNGYVEFGQERRMILTHTGNAVTLMNGIPDLLVGSSVNVYAGCNRTAYDCQNKFNNYTRFWGFDRIPKKNPFGQTGVL